MAYGVLNVITILLLVTKYKRFHDISIITFICDYMPWKVFVLHQLDAFYADQNAWQWLSEENSKVQEME